MLRLGYLLLFVVTTSVLGQNEVNPNYWINASKRKIKDRLTAGYKNNGTAKNVIVVLVDGMDLDFISLARNEWGRSEFSFEKFPNAAMLKTYCIDGQAPDQACATTALLTGVKTNKGLVGLEGRAVADDCDSAPGRRITSMLDWAAKAGKRTGLVTTSRITGPSIASAYGHSAGSSWEGDVDIDMNMAQPCNDIAKQLVEGQTNNKFNNVVHSLEPGETETPRDAELLGVSPGSKLCTAFLNIAKRGEKTMTFQFTGKAPEPEINSM